MIKLHKVTMQHLMPCGVLSSFLVSREGWALIILLLSIAFVFVVVGIAIILSILSGNATFVFTGEIDVGQYNAIIIGVAMVAVTLVAQQLTARTQRVAVKDTDDAWKENP